jgi:hypothetical protein
VLAPALPPAALLEGPAPPGPDELDGADELGESAHAATKTAIAVASDKADKRMVFR